MSDLRVFKTRVETIIFNVDDWTERQKSELNLRLIFKFYCSEYCHIFSLIFRDIFYFVISGECFIRDGELPLSYSRLRDLQAKMLSLKNDAENQAEKKAQIEREAR